MYAPCVHCDSQIKMKVDKTKEDKVAEANRSELLRFLNSSYD